MNTFVESLDGQYYIDPVLWGVDWFVRFEEDNCEIFVRKFKKSSVESCRRRGTKVLGQAGVKGTVELGGSAGGIYAVPPDFRIEVQCCVFDVLVRAPIPVPMTHRGVVTSPGSDNLKFVWTLSVRTETVWDFLRSPENNIRLTSFLLGEPYWITRALKDTKLAKKRLLKQYPGLGKLSLEEALAQYGKNMELKRFNVKGI